MGSVVDKRKQILDAATKLFSLQGLADTNIRQIAQQAKANSALIFYYFGCKENLFFSCLAEMATERLKIAQEILVAPVDARDFELKLEMFANSMGVVFETKRDLIRILHREIDNSNSKAVKIFHDHFVPVAETLFDFFRAAQKAKVIRKDLNPRDLVFDFFALLGNHVRNEAIYKVFAKSKINSEGSSQVFTFSAKRIVELFLKGVT